MDLLPFLIGGLTTGSVYGLAGVGLVLTYKTSGIFNFAYGSLATVAAFIFYTLHDQQHISWPLAAAIAVLIAGPVLGLGLELLGRLLIQSSLATQVVGTLGIVLVVEAGVLLLYGTTTTRVVAPYLPTSDISIGGTPVATSNILIFGISLMAALGLYVYFRVTRTGLAMRGVVDDQELLALAGTNPVAIRRRAWMVGVTFAALSGVLVAPLLAQIDGTTLTLLVVTAFGAAAIGSFTNIPLTYLGGLIIGVGGSLATKYFTSGTLSALPSALPFVVLFIVLLCSPKDRLARRSASLVQRSANWRAPAPLQAGGGLLVLIVLIVVPSFAGIHLGDWTSFASYITLFLSLGLLVRTSGQVSLCHAGFLAIGVAAFSHLTVDHHVPWLVALLLSGLIAVPVGAVLAFPAIRLSGLYLALASLGFGIVLAYMFYAQDYMFGHTGAGLQVPRPHLSWLDVSSDRGYYYVVLSAAVLTTALLVGLNRSRLGRLLSALSASPTGLTTSGTAVNVTRVLVFCVSAFLAAISGALGGGVVGVVTADNYAPLLSLTFFVLVMITVGGDPWYAILAAAGVTIFPSYIAGPEVTNYLTLIFGLTAIVYAVSPGQAGLPRAAQAFIDRLPGMRRSGPVPVLPSRPARGELGRRMELRTAHLPAGGLQVSGLRVRFGGLIAVDDVSFEAPVGRITGLIGPNGAGKTTAFNVCSGLQRPSAGTVILSGTVVSRRGPSARARQGLGRTFQRMELFETLTVRQNVTLGREAGFAGANPLSHILASPRQRREAQSAADEAIQLCDIAAIADRPVRSLSTGERRLVELARCLAGSFDVLLLDEPSSGLDRFETDRFGAILESVVRERGVGILLVEHDMALVTAVCSYIYMLDFGRMLFAGTPAETVRSPIVRAAYLGSESMPGLELVGLETDR